MEWISVEDKAPKKNSDFMAYVIHGAEHKDDINKGIYQCFEDNGCYIPAFSYFPVVVTHWMPLPEPPRE
jgi:hypothetical protein